MTLKAAMIGMGAAVAAGGREVGTRSTATATVAVVVTSERDSVGLVRLVLVDSPEALREERPAVRTAAARLSRGAVEVELTDVPAGTYAMVAYLDRNGNGLLDRGVLGRPLEPYGFSNGARGRLGPPSFTDTRFHVATGRHVVRITLE